MIARDEAAKAARLRLAKANACHVGKEMRFKGSHRKRGGASEVVARGVRAQFTCQSPPIQMRRAQCSVSAAGRCGRSAAGMMTARFSGVPARGRRPFSAKGSASGMSFETGGVCAGSAGLGASGVCAGAMLHPHSPLMQHPCSQGAALTSLSPFPAPTAAPAPAITAIQKRAVMKVLIQEQFMTGRIVRAGATPLLIQPLKNV